MNTIAVYFLLLGFFSSRNNFLISIIILEIIILFFFFSGLWHLNQLNQPVSPVLFILVLSACEASLGLSLLISITRFIGNDVITQINLNF